MRVRIRRDPDIIERWIVETKRSFFSPWRYECSLTGGDAKNDALAIADLVINPEIVEVKKR